MLHLVKNLFSPRKRFTQRRSYFQQRLQIESLEDRRMLAGDFDFVFGLGSAGDEVGGDVATDAAGNVYATGAFSQTVDFDPDSGSATLLTSQGGVDGYIAKYSNSGNLLWARAIGSTGHDTVTGVTTDSAGNVYASLTFSGTVDFDRTAVQAGDTLTSQGGGTLGLDGALLKLDALGNFVWSRAFGGSLGHDETGGVAVDSAGNVYTTGVYLGTVDFDQTGVSSGDTLSPSGSLNVFALKLDTNGDFVWARGFAGSSQSVGNDIALDSLGNVYTSGQFRDTTDFDPGASTFNLSASGRDTFVSKLDTDGNFQWARAWGSGGVDIAGGLGVDSQDNVIIASRFEGTVDFDRTALNGGADTLSSQGGVDYSVLKLDSTGDFVWVRGMGGPARDDTPASGHLTVDSQDSIYFTGEFQATADFDLTASYGDNRDLLTSSGDSDGFIGKLDADGNFQWVRGVGGNAGRDAVTGIGVDSGANVYVTGIFLGVSDFDGTTSYGDNRDLLTSAGGRDSFLLKLTQNPPPIDFDLAFSLDSSGTAVENPTDIVTDAAGNAYLAGYFNGVMDVDPGAGVSNLTGNGNDDAFVAKYDSAGGLVWARSFGGTGTDRAFALGLDNSGNVLVSGIFSGTGDFDPGAGVHNLSSNGSDDGFLVKLDNSGDFVWAFNVGGNGSDAMIGLDVDSSDNIYTTGVYKSHLGGVDFDPSASTFAPSINGGGSQDVFVAKYDASGNLTWAKAFGSSNFDLGVAIAVDASGDVYTTGDFWGGDIDPGAGVQIAASHGARDAFVQKLDTNGNFLWGGTVGGPAGNNVEGGSSVVVDSTGAAYFSGQFGLTADLNPDGAIVDNFTATGPTSNGLPPSDGYLIKLDQTGSLVWARQLGGDGFDPIHDVAIDSQGHIWAVGNIQGTVDFDPSAATANITVPGITGVTAAATTAGFLWELDSNGGFVSVNTYVSPPVSFVAISEISIDPQDNIWIAGAFSNTTDFDPGPGTFNLTPVDGNDLFVSKLVQNALVLNTSPVAVDDSVSVNEDGALIVDVANGVLTNDSDIDGDPLTAVLVSGPSNGALVLNADGSFSYTPNADFNGVDSFSYVANDGTDDSNVATVSLTITPVNDDPVADNDAYATDEDVPLIVAADGVLTNDSDIDGDPLTAVLVSGPSNGALTLNADGSFSYTPNADFNGVDSFSYVANDGTVDSNVATVSLSIAPVNDDPVATDDSYEINEDGELIVVAADGLLSNDSDIEGDALFAILGSGPSNGALVLNADGSFTYDPFADFNGSDSFIYEVNDGNGGLATATVTIDVLSSQQQIDQLNDQIQNLVIAGDLNQKDADKLLKKLNKAGDKLADGRNDKAIKELKKFNKEVAKRVAKGDLSSIDGAVLQAAAFDLIASADVSKPQVATQSIIDNLKGLVTADDLNQKDAKKLIKELNKAIKEFDELEINDGIEKLEKFIEKVTKLINKGKLDTALGAALIADATAAIPLF